MVLSFHPNIVAGKNILCAGRFPTEEDRTAISGAEAVILPQGCSEALYRLCRKYCPHVFPNYDVRFDFPGKVGQARLFHEMRAPVPLTYGFDGVAAYQEQFGQGFPDGPLGFPCVFKCDLGGEGEGVYLLKTRPALEKVLGHAGLAEKSGQKGFLLQQYVPSRGRTLRVVVIGRQVFSYWRIQQDPAKFLTTLRAGAVIDHQADPALQKAGKDAVEGFCARTGINLAGFDLLFSEAEKEPTPLFLEINYFFGRRGLGGSLRYYELLDQAVTSWLAGLGLAL